MRSFLTVLTLTLLGAAVVAQGPPQGARQGGPPPGGRGGAPLFFPRMPTLPFPGAPQMFETLHERIRVVPFVSGLEAPWSIAFLPSGEMLVTEKAGRLRMVRNGKLDPQPLSGVPQVLAAGQGGLLEVAVHPQFAQNRWVYLTYSKTGERGNTTALARGRLDGNALTDVRDIFVADAWSNGPIHFGSKLAFGPDGMLYMTVGERNERDRAQLLTDHAGTILRLRDDGTVPPDNPFVGRADAKPEIYSYGHRNPQALAFRPGTNELWSTEHGPMGGDELNVIRAGRNYGWPVVTLGREYSGQAITDRAWHEGMEPPVYHWTPSPGLSGMVFYTGDRLPQWKDNLFLGGLSGQFVQRIALRDGNPWGLEPLLNTLRQRIRDIRQGPDGLLYIAVDAQQSGILRIEPAAGTN
jgi:aldose sugar dehydrogenase